MRLTVLFFLVTTTLYAQWIDNLPAAVRAQIYWSGDVEEGSLYDWTYDDFLYPGGGIFNTGANDVTVAATQAIAHSGQYAIEATITNAFQEQNGARAVRIFRWTDKPWDDGGDHFPNDSYYSVWMYFPENYNPNQYAPWDTNGDGGWWNIFQFKSDDAQGQSQPIFTLNVDHNDASNSNYLYLYTKENSPNSIGQSNPKTLPTNQWVHIEAFYRQSDTNGGIIRIWQDGDLILEATGQKTILTDPASWSFNNYTDHISGGSSPGTATIYFDDAIVSAAAIHPHLDAALPVTFVSSDVTWRDPHVMIKWAVANESGMDHYVIEKLRADKWIYLGNVHAQNRPDYEFIDLTTKKHEHQVYRISAVNWDGSIQVGPTISYYGQSPEFSIHDGKFLWNPETTAFAHVSVAIFDNSGKCIKSFKANPGSEYSTIFHHSALLHIIVTDPNGRLLSAERVLALN